MHGDDVATQRLLNDLYRTLLGVKRADRVRVSELADRTRCPTLNQIVAKQAAMSAWRSQNGGPLDDILDPYDDRTRGAALEKRKPVLVRCIAASNLCGTLAKSCMRQEHLQKPNWQHRNLRNQLCG